MYESSDMMIILKVPNIQKKTYSLNITFDKYAKTIIAFNLYLTPE